MERITIINQIKTFQSNLNKTGFLWILLFCFSSVFAQKNTNKPFLATKLMPVEFRKQIRTVNDEFKFAYGMRIDSTMIPELIKDLSDTTYIGLTNANDVNIWCRVKTGQMKQNSLNYQIDDDIFKVCGRASWILKRLSKNEFGNIRCATKYEDILAIQKQWQKWLSTLKVK